MEFFLLFGTSYSTLWHSYVLVVRRFPANLDIIARENVARTAIKYKYLDFYEGMNIGVSLLCQNEGPGLAGKSHEQPSSCGQPQLSVFIYPTCVRMIQRFFDMHSPRDVREHYQRGKIFFFKVLVSLEMLARGKRYVNAKENEKREYDETE